MNISSARCNFVKFDIHFHFLNFLVDSVLKSFCYLQRYRNASLHKLPFIYSFSKYKMFLITSSNTLQERIMGQRERRSVSPLGFVNFNKLFLDQLHA